MTVRLALIRIWNWLLGQSPETLTGLMGRPRRPAISNLYILRVDFPVKPEIAESIDKALQPLRDRYGLDFLVLEPGMKLSRFEDI